MDVELRQLRSVVAVADARSFTAASDSSLTPTVRDSIGAWRRDNPPGKRGTHDYALDDYGLDARDVADEYAFYIERFGVPAEGAATR